MLFLKNTFNLKNPNIIIFLMLLFTILLILPPPALASTHSIIISENSNRSNSIPLESSTLAGLVYIQVIDDPSIDQVNFYLNSSTGTPYRTENSAPYDMAGPNNDGTASPLNTTELLDGSHYIHVSIVLTDGSKITDTAYFIVNNSSSTTDYVLLDVRISGPGVIKDINSGRECRKSNCSFKFETGTSIHISAAPTNNTDEFSGWEGICEGKNDCIFSIDYDNTITAIFSEQFQDTQSQSSPTFDLVFNTNPERDNPSPLQSDNLSELVYIELLSSSQIKNVAFYLDSNPDSTSNAWQIERNAPYDFAGTNSNNAPLAFDTKSVPNGAHTIFALITLENGTNTSVRSDFNILNTEPIQDTQNKSSPTFDLVFNTNPERDNPSPLQSGNLSELVYIELLSSSQIKNVAFYLDSNPGSTSNARQIERNAPYDFAGTNSSNAPLAFDTKSVSNGAHTIFALITFENGTNTTVRSDFNILNKNSEISDTINDSSINGQTTISWSAPTKRESGIKLLQSEISRYVIYYGTQSRVYTDSIEITEKINNVLPTSALVEHLKPGVVYYFSGSTGDSSGVLSKISNEISKLIPQ